MLKMKISKEKKDKIAEQLLSILFHNFPKPVFTANIARELARDEEFIKSILLELKEKKLVTEINKNSDGNQYLRRKRWMLSSQVYDTYKQQSY